MGGTTFPFVALEQLTQGRLDPGSGEFVTADGSRRCYFATDNLRAPAYVGLSPEDFFDIVREHHLWFDAATRTGPAFSMIGALSEFGRLGVTCIADTPEAADGLYRRVVETLDAECSGVPGRWYPPTHPVGLPIAGME